MDIAGPHADADSSSTFKAPRVPSPFQTPSPHSSQTLQVSGNIAGKRKTDDQTLTDSDASCNSKSGEEPVSVR
ncbi:hypothetical protein ZHAS_00015038 [Anopheles sinensis]|uniref:Uncharacterized protein n=1 Tax=Anopheles sinensis TaxID=74873 RepID=A0A084W9V4_ANOSI|nr:hypothetical protein ZHAS_00015038 [Anopheles sinensis]